METETIQFNGISFNRYPNSEKREHRCYYRPHAGHIRNGITFLHREIWKGVHGEIPPGHHIHHIDGDSLNNAIENLVSMPGHEHMSIHAKEWTAANMEYVRKHLDEIRPLTKEWHASKDGRAWHVKHGKEAYKSRVPMRKVCVQCGEEFDDISRRETDRYCSNKCKSAWRRAQGLDNEERICATCGKPFTVNKYAKTQCCTKSCGTKLQWKLRRN